MAGLEIDVLGPFTVRRDGERVRVASARQRALLSALALRAGRTVPLDTLAHAVWGDEPPVHVRASLFTLVYRLRALVGEECLHTAPAGYRLGVPPERVDVLRFQGLLDAASGAADDAEAHERIVAALALWRGDPLVDAGSAVTEAEFAGGLTERRLGAVERRADLELRLRPGPHGELIASLRELTARHPLRESLWRRLLAALGAAGRQAEALDAYETVRRLLDDELGTLPSAELRAVHQELLRAGAHTDPAPAAAARHGGSAGTAAGGGGPQVVRRLPPALDGFVGRERELAVLDAAAEVADGAGRAAIVVVHGIGGAGKTSLAVRWAHRAAARFPGGQLPIDLRGYGPGTPLTPHHALGVLLSALGVHRDRIPAGTDERRVLLPEVLAGRGVLLILDNARDVQQVRPLLPGPGGTAVVTSRNRLSGLTIREGARSVPLGEMSTDEARTMLADAVGAGRAAAEPEAVRRLADICGRLPLALRVVAELVSRHPDASLAHFADTLAEDAAGLDALAVADDPASDPRTVFSWSYRELDAAEARLFRLFSLVPGGRAGAADAAALTGGDAAGARAALASLAALHLLEEETPGRYRAHDLLREYAAERAAAEEPAAELDAALERLLVWYLHTAGSAVRSVHSNWFVLGAPSAQATAPVPVFDGDVARASDWLGTWLPDLVAAVARCAEEGRHTALALLIADRLRAYFWGSLRMPEWEVSAEAALRVADAHGDAAARGAARLCLADFNAHANRYEDAVRLYREAGELAEEAERYDLLGATLNNLAGIHWRAGRLAESADCLTRVLEFNRRLGRFHGQYSNHSNLSTVCLRLGRTEEAYDHLHRALDLASTDEERSHCAANLGAVAHALGRFEEALRHARVALPLVQEAKDGTWEADCHCFVADVHRDAGREDEARRAARAALAVADRVRDPLVTADSHLAAGAVELRFGRHERAGELYREALALAIEHSLLSEETSARVGIAAVSLALGRTAEAAGSAAAALGLARRHGFADREGDAQVVLARVGLAEGDPEGAAGPAGLAVATYESVGRPVSLARALFILGRTGDSGALRRALDVFTELGCAEAGDVRAYLNGPHHAAGQPG
ncbi:AfsR/SARP family transcriptional regulator [Streptomyces sp. NPDC050560]|uniref:AfsR/SARP family transcriptional regulator n=1 Tax=Streptomyces sp. NPDC050560 TaxID=3365630 RepID=UPI0037AFA7FC